MIFSVCVIFCMSDLDGGPQDGELGRLSSGFVGLQDPFDEPLDLPLRHPVAVARLTEDVDALGQLVVDTRLAHRRPHGGGGSGNDGGLCRSNSSIFSCGELQDHGVTCQSSQKLMSQLM